jgi:CBS domain-containing protein
MPTAKEIMNTQPPTVGPDNSIRDLAEILTETRYDGASVVDAEGRLIGVATESDIIFQKKPVHLPTFITILDAVLPFGGEDEEEIRKILGSTVREIMTSEPLTVTPDSSLEEIAAMMNEVHKSILPVVDGETLVGVIDRHDIVRAIMAERSGS